MSLKYITNKTYSRRVLANQRMDTYEGRVHYFFSLGAPKGHDRNLGVWVKIIWLQKGGGKW